MKPEWIIYKDDQKIGQAVTWHKALDILIILENIDFFAVEGFKGIIFVRNNRELENPIRYKIVKEN